MKNVENVMNGVRDKYSVLFNRKMEMSGGQNIMGHIVTKFIDLQDRLEDCDFTHVELDDIEFPACRIMNDEGVEVIIICADFSDKSEALKEIMLRENTKKAIWITGTAWNLVSDNALCSMDFDDSRTFTEFEKFML